MLRRAGSPRATTPSGRRLSSTSPFAWLRRSLLEPKCSNHTNPHRPKSKKPHKGAFCFLNDGGEGGIRTLDGLLTHTPLAGERLRPLGHLSCTLKMSAAGDYNDKQSGLFKSFAPATGNLEISRICA